jgi:hypothetical protein
VTVEKTTSFFFKGNVSCSYDTFLVLCGYCFLKK